MVPVFYIFSLSICSFLLFLPFRYFGKIDNAKDLATTGGLQLLIDALNSTQDEIKLEAAFVLGSAVQRFVTSQVVRKIKPILT